MKRNLEPILLMFILLFAGSVGINAAELDKPAPDFTLTDASGNTHSLSDYRGKSVVLEWVNYGCPFVKKHYDSGNMQKLQKTYTEKGVVWLTICSSAPGKQGHYTGEEIQKINKEKGLSSSAYLIDETGKVGRMYDAKTTPHMFIINPEGTLIYAGAIDDKRTTDVADITGAANYVSGMLNDLISGKSVESKSTTPYGCGVKY